MSRTLAASLASLALVLAACGGGNDKKAEAVPTPVKKDQYGCDAAEMPAQKTTKLQAPTAKLDPAKTYVATVVTNCGDFEITLDPKRAPLTTASFKHLADEKFYDGTTIHRIIPKFVFQGGDPDGNGTGGPGYSVTEAPPKSTKYTKGVVAMAKGGSDPAGMSGSQFFVVTGPDGEQLPPDYALVGEITRGESAVQKIGSIITDPRNDAPEVPIVIKSVRVAEDSNT